MYGTITISGDVDKAIECEKGNAVFAESVIASEELERLKLQVDPNDVTMLKKPTLDPCDTHVVPFATAAARDPIPSTAYTADGRAGLRNPASIDPVRETGD